MNETEAKIREALEMACAYIEAMPHGDNCYLVKDGSIHDACFCGKDSVETHIRAALLPAGEKD